MATVLFVHGTGVREQHFERLYRKVEDGVERLGARYEAAPCYWAGSEGAKLRSGGSIPNYAGSELDEAPDEESARWSILGFDPLYEIRLLALANSESGGGAALFGGASAALTSTLTAFDPTSHAELARAAGVEGRLEGAVDELARSGEFGRMADVSVDPAIDERRAMARAVVALAQRSAMNDGALAIDADDRARLVEALMIDFGGNKAGGILDKLAAGVLLTLGGAAFVTAPFSTWAAGRQRSAIADHTSPMAGDVVLYQARGDGIRNYIRECIRSADDEVVLVGHSLGGIACVDLLASEHQPTVTHLVTVGSQAPYLYELGALWSLEFGEPLPATFPPWLNIYDRHDFLSFVSGEVFSGRIRDEAVDNRCSFPQSHSAYWGNDDTWQLIGEFVDGS